MNPMRRLQVLIVDDEELARLRLRSLLADCALPGAEVVGEAGSGAEALHWLSHGTADLVLLDIRMPGIGGLQLAERLRAMPAPPKVVFVTAHAEHALQAFEIDAVDYLTKPVRRARLQEALVRVAQRLGVAAPPAAAAAASAGEQPVLVVSDRGRVQRVPVADILYLKAELKYVTLRTAAHAYVLDDSLSDLEQRLGGAMLRVHRNALVARSAIRKLERRPASGADAGDADAEAWAVQIGATQEWLAVSRRQLSQVRELLASDGV
ncbi:MAG: LytR/AlgR family response regulator transcription factor [Burkholderiaceae bacterium]